MADFNTLQKLGLGLQLTDRNTQANALNAINQNNQLNNEQAVAQREARIKQLDYSIDAIQKGLPNLGAEDQVRVKPYFEKLIQERQSIIGGAELGQSAIENSPTLNGGQGLYSGLVTAENKPEAKIGTVSPDKNTPESMQAFAESGNFTDLVPRGDDKPIDQYAALKTKPNLTPEEKIKLDAFENQFGSKGQNKIGSRVVVSEGGVINGVDQVSGGLIPMLDDKGKPMLSESAVQKRLTQKRLTNRETRLTMNSLDKTYKDFAHKNRLFIDQADAYNEIAKDNDPRTQSVRDKVLVHAFIRRIKPTGTISASLDLNSIDGLKSFPESLKAGIIGFFKTGKIQTDRTRNAMISYVSKELAIAKKREKAVIINSKRRANKLGEEWQPPIFLPGESGIEEVDEETLEDFDAEQSNFDFSQASDDELFE